MGITRLAEAVVGRLRGSDVGVVLCEEGFL